MERKVGKRTAPNKVYWSEEMDSYLRENFRSLDNRSLANGLGLKLTVVRNRLYELGLKRMELEYWTDEQVDYLRTFYTKMGDREIAKEFAKRWPKSKGWSHKHINKKRNYLSLNRTPEQIEAIRQRNVDAGCFKTDKAQKNRAKRRYPEGKEIVRKKGLNGRFYSMVKVGDRIEFAYRYYWEQKHGPIPEGMILRCKSSDSLNSDPENWELITRSDHAIRNALSDAGVAGRMAMKNPELKKELLKYPELLEVKRLSYQLNLQIKNGSHKTT